MVVVAIIGILSAVAVPNFKKYQAKSKQSEAKIQLAAVYNSEVGTQADYDTFATCLPRMGYERTPRGYYVVGFLTAYTNAKFANCAADATLATGPINAAHTDNKSLTPVDYLAAETSKKPANITLASTASETDFTAVAEGSISASPAIGSHDQWTIDHTKKINNFRVGY